MTLSVHEAASIAMREVFACYSAEPMRNEAQTKSSLALAAPIEELQRKLSDKCASFGLPPNFDALMRHMENNHAATVGVQRSHIESLERQLKEARAASCDEEKPCVK